MLPSVPVATADLVLAAVALPMILAALVGFVHSVQPVWPSARGASPLAGPSATRCSTTHRAMDSADR